MAGAMRKKLFAGQALRRLRERDRWTQTEFAERLGISTAYLSQIETNQRPLTAPVLLALRETFGIDVAVFTAEDPSCLTAALREALADPVFTGVTATPSEIHDASATAPWLARALLDLHGAYRRLHDRLNALDDTLGTEVAGRLDARATPFEEVRDFFQFTDNYVDLLDRAGERLAERLGRPVGNRPQALADYLRDRHDVRIAHAEEDNAPMRAFDRAARVLTLRADLEPSTETFLMACQIGMLEQTDAIASVIAGARFTTPAAEAVARLALVNYFGAAVLLPYRRFLSAARNTRHDLERLARTFGASLEQVGHRLSSLQRPDEKGVPVYFVKVDRAGNVVKRHSATRFHFARFGGACALWNVHEAFETPDRILTQVAELPDGTRYLSLAKCVTKPRTHYGELTTSFAIGIGCELHHAHEFVYAQDIDLKLVNVARIGVSCRICERTDCHQRAVPAVDHTIVVDPDVRGDQSYTLMRS